MLHLGKHLNQVVEPEYKLEKVRCCAHEDREEYCKFAVSNKSTNQYDIIHDVHGNYSVRQHLVYCEDRPSRLYNILRHNQKFIIKEASNDDHYVKIDGKYIFKVKERFFTLNLLIHLNEITINGQHKSIG